MEAVAINVEHSTTPLIPQSKEKITKKELEEILKRFNAIFDDKIKFEDRMTDFKTLLCGEDIARMERIYSGEKDKMRNIKNHLPDQKSFLVRFSLQRVLAKMLKNIAKYVEFLKLFIERFAAYNERIEEKYLPRDDANKHKTNEQPRPIINNDTKPILVLDAPLHCAIRQLNEDLIEWLLEQTEGKTEVNLRNGRKETTLAILCGMYDWCKELVPKLKTRLKDIEKERERADKKQQIKLDAEKIKVSALMEEMKMNAPTILKLIKRLLEKGADFNIYMNDDSLPFDFLWKYYIMDKDVTVLIDSLSISNVAMTKKPPMDSNVNNKPKDKVDSRSISNVAMAKKPPMVSNVNNKPKDKVDSRSMSNVAMTKKPQMDSNVNNKPKGKDKSKKRLLMFYKESEDKDVTVELLEIFICFNNLEKFRHYWNAFEVTSENVKHVIKLLLHVAVERNSKTYVDLITDRASEEIFKLKENEIHNLELKGLLKKVCLNGNTALLNFFLENITDRLLLHENPLVVVTLQKMHKMKNTKEFKPLMNCVKMLIYNHKKIDLQGKDTNGNTALHLALSYGYDKIATLMLNQGKGLMGLMNKQNLTPIEYGTTEFWNNYLDNCITIKDKTELRFNVGFLGPLAEKESTNVKPSKASNVSKSYFKFVKLVAEMSETHNSKYRFTRTVNDMTALRLISQSTDRKEFLMHPVIIAFISMKWKRLCHWHILNLLLTTLTMGAFMAYTLMSCPSGGWIYGFILGAWIIIVLREIMQWCLLGWSYFTLENAVDILNVVFIGIVLFCGCDRDGWRKCVPGLSSFVFVSLSLQATFLLGATWNNLSITLYMFKTVSRSFFYSFLSFSPVIVAFICSFYQMYNDPSGISISNGTESNSSAENFNNFHSSWDAAIKTLVMTTGEFEAANINYDGGRWLLFVAFLFIAPIVILNLINGLAVNDITDIRKESEFISVCKKVKLLERYERAIVKSRSTMSGCLQWLFRVPLLPSPFFENYESFIYVMVNEKNKLAIKLQNQENSTKEVIQFFPWLPSWCLKRYIGIRSFQLVPYMSLDQSYVNKAKTIARNHSNNNSGRGTNELADTEQTDRPALVNKTAMHQYKTSTISRSATGPSVPDSRDKQIKKLQGQVRNIIAMLTDIQQQLAGSHASKAESTASTSGDHSRVQ